MKQDVRVEGMTCGGCERSVKEALMELEGVLSAEASFLENVVRVDYDPDMISIRAIMSVIVELGFRVVP
ncbi:heavy-metal-associated domain family protein [Pelodictyon luteolum DSM 273]|uniref:Heavy-metal-associated domain family protein n=2 Tax=Pelodictyon luteolum TaxID=1100 RepID=Q3B609_CHLL3|nr:heavy-metal-associated domain family protein [Pelodictyon luteolum DSM 273]